MFKSAKTYLPPVLNYKCRKDAISKKQLTCVSPMIYDPPGSPCKETRALPLALPGLHTSLASDADRLPRADESFGFCQSLY